MMKKLLIFIISFCFVILVFNFEIEAATFSDNNLASYKINENNEELIYNSALFRHDLGVTTKKNVDYKQQVNVLEMETSDNSKLVTWAVKDSTNSGFVRKTVSDIAKDYELNHPGWKVIGGMNADQYYTKSGTQLGADGSDYFYPQPYYPMIADYEKWFSISATPTGSGNIVGIANDGSIDQLHYFNAGWNNTSINKVAISGLYLTVKGEVDQKFLIENVNTSPNENESSLYSPYYVGTSFPRLNISEENLFIVEKSDLAFMSNSVTYTYKPGNNQNAFFGKGKISKIADEASLGKGQFAISTHNEDLKNALSIGKEIIVQYEYEGVLNTFESGIGFHTIMRVDGVDRTSNATYNTSLYPRAILGRKDDGKVVLLTVDGRQAPNMVGVNMDETNAILKHYGVVEAYQLDGGGSVTMIIRDGVDFITTNSPSDGYDRSVLSALLMVVKLPDVEEEVIRNQDSLEFNIVNNDASIDNLYIKIGDEIKEVIDGKAMFSDLKSNTQYNYEYWTYIDDKFEQTLISGKVTTLKIIPKVESVSVTKSTNGMSMVLNVFDPDNAIYRNTVDLTHNGVTISSINRNIVFEGEYNFYLNSISVKFEYDINDGLGKKEIQDSNVKVNMNLIVYLMNSISELKESVRNIYG
ncbi:MAG: phosphodiester glycosidase family protein [Bacilli bacterium]